MFALISPFSARADQALTDMVEAAEIPSIAPFTQFPSAKGGQHQYTFYLYGGLDTQIEALIQRATEKDSEINKLYILFNKNAVYKENATRALENLSVMDDISVELIAYENDKPEQLLQKLDTDEKGHAAVIFIGLASDLSEVSKRLVTPTFNLDFYIPGFFVTSKILKLPEAVLSRLKMAYLSVPGSSDDSLNEFKQFIVRNQLAYSYLNIRLSTYSALQTLFEGVKRSGKRVTRKKLVNAIEGLYNFDAGLNQPISFGSRRRTGINGSYIVSMDASNKRLIPDGNWVELK